MAYINQQMKKEIMAEVKKVLPQGWKVSARIFDDIKIVLNVKLDEISAQEYNEIQAAKTFSVKKELSEKSQVTKKIEALRNALNSKNYDKSNADRDYFNVGYYTGIEVIA